MKPFYTKVTSQFDNSVTIRYDEKDQFYPHWHYHDEYEIVYIHKSHGIRYVGDSINPYQEGDLVLIGSRLPHIWINKSSEENVPNPAASTIIHLQRKFIRNSFFNLPLMENLRLLFERSTRGIYFKNIEGIEAHLSQIQKSVSSERVIAVLELLSKLSRHLDYEYLSSSDYQRMASEQGNDRLSKVHDYLANNFTGKISLAFLAEKVHMTSSAFCTYFKGKTGKTVFTYINDLKLGYACKLLIESDQNIEQIALESGYNNTTFFNRKFKAKHNITPKAYRQKFTLKV